MRRLYLQLYLAVVGILVLFAVLGIVAWRVLPHDHDEANDLDEIAALAGELLPAADRPASELQGVLDRIGPRAATDITVFDRNRQVVARVGGEVPGPEPTWIDSRWVRHRGGPPALALLLPDERWLVLQHHRPRRWRFGWTAAFGILALAVGIGAYPLMRRLTRRLERLQQRVDALGAGDLTTRVVVEGHDEVAELARSFNRAAERIERLVASQRQLLANASHELRSPLARVRMAIELLDRQQRPELHARIEHDIAELDQLIDELLLASRLEAQPQLVHVGPVDLLEIARDESARVKASVSGSPAIVSGDARLLKRLVRNLLDNAQRYGAGMAIDVAVARGADGAAQLTVCDRGPGVPPAERERIFDPFYRLPGTREGDGGIGLGLALVRQIARHHGGEVRCRARDGGGTCFEVTLPPAPATTTLPPLVA